jgi:secretion/DNA translocation related TadE-like protein
VCRDRGSVTIWAAALAGLIWLGASAALLHGSAVAGRHRAETAADLAALAAAVHVPDGTACAVGARIAADNGASLRGCQVVGDEVEVVVSRRVSLGRLGAFPTVARARAGPVESARFNWTDATRGRRGARRPVVPE